VRGVEMSKVKAAVKSADPWRNANVTPTVAPAVTAPDAKGAGPVPLLKLKKAPTEGVTSQRQSV
jgi:hypothetical protein